MPLDSVAPTPFYGGMNHRRLRPVLLLAALFLSLAPLLHGFGITYTYTFESVDITVPPVTPVLQLAPDTNADGFTTTFTSPLADSYVINQYNGPTLISGHNLLFNPFYLNGTAPSDLTLTFSQPVESVSFTISAPSGLSSVTATSNLGEFQLLAAPSAFDIGIPTYYINLTPTNQFTALTLSFGYSNDSTTFYAIDDIAITAVPVFTPVPEPTTWAALLGGLGWLAGGFGFKRWRARRTG